MGQNKTFSVMAEKMSRMLEELADAKQDEADAERQLADAREMRRTCDNQLAELRDELFAAHPELLPPRPDNELPITRLEPGTLVPGTELFAPRRANGDEDPPDFEKL